MTDYTADLSSFLAGLEYADIPKNVIQRTEELFLDWLGSALAGRNERPIPIFAEWVQAMGPQSGSAQILTNQSHSSPVFAALLNGASSHVVEQDDLHNSSVLHPATVVFPAALAAAQDLGRDGQEFILACVAGYEAGIRIGEFMGRSHYRIFHTTATVGTLAAAVAVAKLHRLDTEGFINTLGSAGTQASGLWEFLRDAADSKQLHTGQAAANGLMSAYLAAKGFTGARHILEGQQGMAAGMSSDSDPAFLIDRLGTRWALLETSFKFHASCRHTHPAADALLELMTREGLTHDQIISVTARVHQGAIDVLGRVDCPSSIHQAKFSMGTVLGLIAIYGRAGLTEFHEYSLTDPKVAEFRAKTEMVLDDEVDNAYPARWLGRVVVKTADGRTLNYGLDEPKGDPGNTLTREELEAKFRRLLTFAQIDSEEADPMIAFAWSLSTQPSPLRIPA